MSIVTEMDSCSFKIPSPTQPEAQRLAGSAVLTHGSKTLRCSVLCSDWLISFAVHKTGIRCQHAGGNDVRLCCHELQRLHPEDTLHTVRLPLCRLRDPEGWCRLPNLQSAGLPSSCLSVLLLSWWLVKSSRLEWVASAEAQISKCGILHPCPMFFMCLFLDKFVEGCKTLLNE